MSHDKRLHLGGAFGAWKLKCGEAEDGMCIYMLHFDFMQNLGGRNM